MRQLTKTQITRMTNKNIIDNYPPDEAEILLKIKRENQRKYNRNYRHKNIDQHRKMIAKNTRKHYHKNNSTAKNLTNSSQIM